MLICLKEQVDAIYDKLVSYRQDFHRQPELGWLEIRTTSIIANELNELGYEVLVGDNVCKPESRMGLPSEDMEYAYERALEQGAVVEYAKAKYGFTGVIGILKNGEGPTIALRFDIDALPIQESTDETHIPFKEGFSSINEGVMHACGHDAHITIGLGVANILAKNKDKLNGTIKLIFQPSEEGVRGAKSIVDNGHLDNVDYLLGSHTYAYKSNDIQVRTTPGTTLATYKMNVKFKGKAAHAAGAPNDGNNALLSAATALLNIQAIPRHNQGDTRVNIGMLEAKGGRNIISDNAYFEMEVRGSTTVANEYMYQYALRIIENSAKMHGCTFEINLAGAAPSSHNSKELNELIKLVGERDLDFNIVYSENTLGGSEDYAYMSEKVLEQGGQSIYFILPSKGVAAPHNELYYFDDISISNGVQIYSAMVYEIMGKRM